MQDRVYVLDVVRVQESAPAFAMRVKALRARYGAAPMRAFIGGTERGTVDFLARDGLNVQALPATGDKWSRAQAAAAAWNAGDLLVPESAPWLDAFVGELLDFSPHASHDDQVDALVGAYDGAARAVTIQIDPPTKQAPNLGGPRGLDRRRLGGLYGGHMLVTGWKDIAGALGVSVRTAQTYRLERGLPVVNLSRRLVSEQRDALERWVAERASRGVDTGQEPG